MEVATNYSDEELIEMINGGTALEKAIQFIYRRHFEMISTHIQQNQGSMQDAEDIFQEALVALIELINQHKFRGEASIKTFLFSINKNMWLNELKRKGRALIRENKFEATKEIIDKDVADTIVSKETRAQIIAIMEQLGEACKKILLAYYYENLSMKEIVKTMNYENDQVLRNKKYKCLKNLEQLINASPSMAKTLKSALQYEL